MGKIKNITSPLKDLTQNDINIIQASVVEGMLTKSDGEILESDDLTAITCPTTAGSPVVIDINGVNYVWGLSIAVEDHLSFISCLERFFFVF